LNSGKAKCFPRDNSLLKDYKTNLTLSIVKEENEEEEEDTPSVSKEVDEEDEEDSYEEEGYEIPVSESDSDSDFVSGVYLIPYKKKKAKRKNLYS